ncbi:hypothetical protein GCM10025779_27140 [Arthrobacter cryoconiti]
MVSPGFVPDVAMGLLAMGRTVAADVDALGGFCGEVDPQEAKEPRAINAAVKMAAGWISFFISGDLS